MTTDTAVNVAPLDRIFWQIRADDFSTRPTNWYQWERITKPGLLLRLPDLTSCGSRGGDLGASASSTALEDWRSRLERPTSNESFISKSELGRKLWALRQKYIAEGGRLYTMEEIQTEVARRRGELG